MLQLNGISKGFSGRALLNHIDLTVNSDSRVGLIGRNGCGKSTLLKVIMGEMEIEEGSIYRSPGLHVNFLTQEPRITPGNTLEEEVKSVFIALNEAVEAEKKIVEDLKTLTGEDQLKALHRLDDLHHTLNRLDAWNLDAKISRLLTDLGFSLEEFSRPVEQFSGGWQMRINLAKILLQGADILLLDEPTNHLDLETCEWLESFLKRYEGGIVIVSHDRRFLDQVVTQIAEVELGELTLWQGNYTRFLELKAEFLEKESTAVERQQKELAKQTTFVERFRASATKSTQAKSREKQLAKVERLEVTKTNTQRISVRFPVPQPSGKQIVSLQDIAKSFGDHPLFQNVNADIQRHQRIFLLGENGCGKTTLFRLILGLEPADKGDIKWGHNALPGYFSQNQLDTLNPEMNLFETLHDAAPKMTQTEIRTLLGGFLFTGDQVFKPVKVLSGGEKSKLALAKLMITGPNMLLLDEPTNHMDIPAKEVLETAFQSYEGSILCISHDRYFIQQLATDIWEIHRGHLITYPGDYDYYLAKRDEFRARSRQGNAPSKSPKPQSASNGSVPVEKTKPKDDLRAQRDVEKKLKRVEKSIMALEEEILAQQTRLTEAASHKDYIAMALLNDTIAAKQLGLAQLNTEWESLTEMVLVLSIP